MSNIQHLQFKEFAEDADVHGVKQLTRADNGLVSSHLLYPLYYQLEKKTSFHNFYGQWSSQLIINILPWVSEHSMLQQIVYMYSNRNVFYYYHQCCKNWYWPIVDPEKFALNLGIIFKTVFIYIKCIVISG